MNDTGTGPTPSPAPSPGERPQPSPQEVAEGKVFAILCYAINFINVPFWLLPLIMRNNEFSLYHAKQCLMLWLFGAVGLAAAAALSPICVGVFLFPVVIVAIIVWNVFGLINAINQRCAPVPLIGVYAEKWFAGIRKVG